MKMITFPHDRPALRPVPVGRIRNGNLSRKVALPTMEGYTFKKVEQIVLLEAEGNYTRFQFVDGSQILVCKTLRNAEDMLAPYPQFVRVHRSFTINLNHIERYVRGKGGYVVMENGYTVSVSNSKKPHFMKLLQCYFGQGAGQ